MRTTSAIIFLLFFWHTSFSQTRDISELSESEKKNELISSLEWLESKMGNGMEFKHRDGYYFFYDLNYSNTEPSKLSISKIRSDTKQILRVISFDLSKIYKIVIMESNCNLNIITYEGQRFISIKENNRTLLENQTMVMYDCAVSNERMRNALDYILKLGGGGKPNIYEKF